MADQGTNTMTKLSIFGGLLLIGAASAYGDVQPLPGNAIGAGGVFNLATVGWGNQPPYTTNGPWVNGAGNLNGGGSFVGLVTSGSTVYETTVWCVDDQLYFNPGDSGPASIVPLISYELNPSTYAPMVRYSGVTNSGTPQWTNTTDGIGNALPSSAITRYEMAAWLVSQYNGGSNILSAAGTPQNTAIQDAIWALTNNNSPSAENGVFNQYSGAANDPTNDLYWVDQALTNYKSVNLSQFAVISWLVDPTTGDPSPVADYNVGARQTFLVELAPTPEPGMYGAMALGLSGMLLAVNAKRRKRQKN
jgi:hypothetical protein